MCPTSRAGFFDLCLNLPTVPGYMVCSGQQTLFLGQGMLTCNQEGQRALGSGCFNQALPNGFGEQGMKKLLLGAFTAPANGQMQVDAGVAKAVSGVGQLLLPLPSDQDFPTGAGNWLSIALAILDGMLREVVSNEVHELADCQLTVFWGPDRDQGTHWPLMPIHGIDQ